GPHLAQRAPQLRLPRPRRGDLGERHDRRRQDQDDCRDDQQLDEGVAARRRCEVRARRQHRYCTVTVTGANRRPITTPPGPVALPLCARAAAPGAPASNSTAASTPVPDAPVASAPRASVMSIRLPLTFW